jgi:hypothetical protein
MDDLNQLYEHAQSECLLCLHVWTYINPHIDNPNAMVKSTISGKFDRQFLPSLTVASFFTHVEEYSHIGYRWRVIAPHGYSLAWILRFSRFVLQTKLNSTFGRIMRRSLRLLRTCGIRDLNKFTTLIQTRGFPETFLDKSRDITSTEVMPARLIFIHWSEEILKLYFTMAFRDNGVPSYFHF